MRVSVIISTYNQPQWLEKVIWGFSQQDHSDLELIVADDGSADETRELVYRLRRETGLTVEHVWQEDSGFRKCAILNKAVLRASSDYLLFTDGDCVPRSDFVSAHCSRAEPGQMLSGGYFKLPLELSRMITREDVVSGKVFDPRWLRQHGMARRLKPGRMSARGAWARILNVITPTKATWNGHNSSAWKRDILRVNGFDERMAYGGEDREMGERMLNAGVKPRQIRYSAVCVHLENSRTYVNDAALAANREIRRATAASRSAWTIHGIQKGPPPAGARAAAPVGATAPDTAP